MIKKTINSIIISIVVLLTNSCVKEIPVKKLNTKPKIVINCIFSNTENWLVKLNYSGNITDTFFSPIDNAIIHINDENNNLIVLQHTINGNYVIAQKPKVNKQYIIKVKVPNFDTVYASDKIPLNNYSITNFNVDSVLTEEIFIDGDGMSNLNPIKFNINDFNQTIVYYKIEPKAFRSFLNPYTRIIDTTYESYFTRSTEKRWLPLNKPNLFYVSDNSYFKNSTCKIPLYFNFNYSKNQGYYSFGLEIKVLSSHNYLYQMALLKQKLSTGELFGNYTNAYTNITNGLGIFAGEHIQTIKF
jgi:hypothetical protein